MKTHCAYWNHIVKSNWQSQVTQAVSTYYLQWITTLDISQNSKLFQHKQRKPPFFFNQSAGQPSTIATKKPTANPTMASPPVAPEWAEACGKRNAAASQETKNKGRSELYMSKVVKRPHCNKVSCMWKKACKWGHVIFQSTSCCINWSQLATNYHIQTIWVNLPSLYLFGCSGSWHVEKNPHPPWDMFFKLRQIAPLPIIDLGRFRMTIRTNRDLLGSKFLPKRHKKMEIHWLPCPIPVCNNGSS